MNIGRPQFPFLSVILDMSAVLILEPLCLTVFSFLRLTGFCVKCKIPSAVISLGVCFHPMSCRPFGLLYFGNLRSSVLGVFLDVFDFFPFSHLFLEFNYWTFWIGSLISLGFPLLSGNILVALLLSSSRFLSLRFSPSFCVLQPLLCLLSGCTVSSDLSEDVGEFSLKSPLASGCFLCWGSGFQGVRAFSGLSSEACLPAYMSEGAWPRAWLGPARCDTVQAPGWAILYSALLASSGLFGVSRRMPPRLLPGFLSLRGPPVRGEGQDLSSGCAGTTFRCLQSGFPTLGWYWRPQDRTSGSLFQRGKNHCLRPRGLTGKTKQKMVFFDSVFLLLLLSGRT